ncbi:MAG TPA: putative collagen-binding domain-containing protein, partial [Polyangia bacterium]|nr:putative collagen-binding domain-containing protein [Polyangia bacterium]
AAAASAALSSDSRLGIVYTPAVRDLTIALSRMSGPVTARWFDPTNGIYSTVSGSPFANTGARVFRPTGSNSSGDPDWVLLLESP